MLPLYCGCPDYMLTALQLKQNEAMRLVTRKKWEVPGLQLTSTKELLRQCGYLSVRQMAYFYSVATVHKTLVHQEPEYLHQILTGALSSGANHRYPTTQAKQRTVKAAHLTLANSSFRWRASTQYSLLLQYLCEEPSLKVFLIKLKEHTRRVVIS